MTRLNSIGRTTWLAVNGIVLISAPAGALFGYLSWQAQLHPGPETAQTAASVSALVQLTDEALDQQGEQLATQKAMLEAFAATLPELQRSRLGIELLVQLTDRAIAQNESLRRPRRSAQSPRRLAVGDAGPSAPDDAVTGGQIGTVSRK